MRPAGILIAARGVRGFGDGFTALLLPVYLTTLGFSPFRVGVLTTATLLGSAALTLAVGLAGHRFPAKRLLFAACVLMGATGLAFSQAHAFWVLAAVGFVGTLNPSGGDVSAFLPLEQSLLAHSGPPSRRTHLFARYSLSGSLMAALGALSVGLLAPLQAATGLAQLTLIEAAFAAYGLLGLISAAFYRALPDAPVETEAPRTPLGPSRRNVYGLAALFSLDSFGGGFLVVAIHLDQHLATPGDRLAVAGHGRPADPLVLGQADHHHPTVFVGLLDEIAGVFRAGVIDADDAVDPGGRLGDHVQDVILDLVAGDHQPHPRSVQGGIEGAQHPPPLLDRLRCSPRALADGRHEPG